VQFVLDEEFDDGVGADGFLGWDDQFVESLLQRNLISRNSINPKHPLSLIIIPMDIKHSRWILEHNYNILINLPRINRFERILLNHIFTSDDLFDELRIHLS
jgi:hypothetical protein